MPRQLHDDNAPAVNPSLPSTSCKCNMSILDMLRIDCPEDRAHMVVSVSLDFWQSTNRLLLAPGLYSLQVQAHTCLCMQLKKLE